MTMSTAAYPTFAQMNLGGAVPNMAGRGMMPASPSMMGGSMGMNQQMQMVASNPQAAMMNRANMMRSQVFNEQAAMMDPMLTQMNQMGQMGQMNPLGQMAAGGMGGMGAVASMGQGPPPMQRINSQMMNMRIGPPATVASTGAAGGAPSSVGGPCAGCRIRLGVERLYSQMANYGDVRPNEYCEHALCNRCADVALLDPLGRGRDLQNCPVCFMPLVQKRAAQAQSRLREEQAWQRQQDQLAQSSGPGGLGGPSAVYQRGTVVPTQHVPDLGPPTASTGRQMTRNRGGSMRIMRDDASMYSGDEPPPPTTFRMQSQRSAMFSSQPELEQFVRGGYHSELNSPMTANSGKYPPDVPNGREYPPRAPFDQMQASVSGPNMSSRYDDVEGGPIRRRSSLDARGGTYGLDYGYNSAMARRMEEQERGLSRGPMGDEYGYPGGYHGQNEPEYQTGYNGRNNQDYPPAYNGQDGPEYPPGGNFSSGGGAYGQANGPGQGFAPQTPNMGQGTRDLSSLLGPESMVYLVPQENVVHTSLKCEMLQDTRSATPMIVAQLPPSAQLCIMCGPLDHDPNQNTQQQYTQQQQPVQQAQQRKSGGFLSFLLGSSSSKPKAAKVYCIRDSDLYHASRKCPVLPKGANVVKGELQLFLNRDPCNACNAPPNPAKAHMNQQQPPPTPQSQLMDPQFSGPQTPQFGPGPNTQSYGLPDPQIHGAGHAPIERRHSDLANANSQSRTSDMESVVYQRHENSRSGLNRGSNQSQHSEMSNQYNPRGPGPVPTSASQTPPLTPTTVHSAPMAVASARPNSNKTRSDSASNTPHPAPTALQKGLKLYYIDGFDLYHTAKDCQLLRSLNGTLKATRTFRHKHSLCPKCPIPPTAAAQPQLLSLAVPANAAPTQSLRSPSGSTVESVGLDRGDRVYDQRMDRIEEAKLTPNAGWGEGAGGDRESLASGGTSGQSRSKSRSAGLSGITSASEEMLVIANKQHDGDQGLSGRNVNSTSSVPKADNGNSESTNSGTAVFFATTDDYLHSDRRCAYIRDAPKVRAGSRAQAGNRPECPLCISPKGNRAESGSGASVAGGRQDVGDGGKGEERGSKPARLIIL